MNQDRISEIADLAAYVSGYATAKNDPKLARAAEWLQKLSRHVCGAGMIGCHGGPKCTSDHK